MEAFHKIGQFFGIVMKDRMTDMDKQSAAWLLAGALITLGLAATKLIFRRVTGRRNSAAGSGGGAAPAPRGGTMPPRKTAAAPISAPKTGEASSTKSGKEIHKKLADERRESGQFDHVQQPITDASGQPILVPKRVDLKTGDPQPGAKMQKAIPDAIKSDRALILDDKPLNRPIDKDRQEIIRFIKAWEQKTGKLPETIAIQRYDPKTGLPVQTDLYKPSDFLPGKK